MDPVQQEREKLIQEKLEQLAHRGVMIGPDTMLALGLDVILGLLIERDVMSMEEVDERRFQSLSTLLDDLLEQTSKPRLHIPGVK